MANTSSRAFRVKSRARTDAGFARLSHDNVGPSRRHRIRDEAADDGNTHRKASVFAVRYQGFV